MTIQRKPLFGLISGLVLSATAIVTMAQRNVPGSTPAGGGSLPQRSLSHDEAKRQSDARRFGNLHDAAKVTGAYIGTVSFASDGPSDLEELVQASEAVVVGTVAKNECVLLDDGHSIGTRYDIDVERVLKGNGLLERGFVVLTPGGRVGFSDGTWAQLETPGFLRPLNKHRYVWFVVRLLDEGDLPSKKAFAAVAGPLGIYPLEGEGNVHTSGGFGTTLSRAIRAARLSPDAFINAISQLTEK